MKKTLPFLLVILLAVSCGKKVESDFIMDKNEIQVGEVIHFTSTATDAVYYHWKFGDGGTSREMDPSHTFTKAGNLVVQLHVSNQGGDDWADAYHEVKVLGYQRAFINQWAITESYTTELCGNGNHIYTINVRAGDKSDEVWVDNFADLFNEPVRGRSPYLAPNKIEFNETNLMTKSGELYNVVGNFILNANVLDVNITLTPSNGTSACGIITGDGLGITF